MATPGSLATRPPERVSHRNLYAHVIVVLIVSILFLSLSNKRV